MKVEKLSSRSLLMIKGADSANLLQSLVTNDVFKNDYSHNYLLNNTGRYLFDFFVAKIKEVGFFVDIAASDKEGFIKKLAMYRLRRDCMIEDISCDYSVVYSSNPMEEADFSGRDPRYKEMGYRSYIHKGKITRYDIIEGVYLADKYSFCLPDGSDLVKERSIPLEYGAQELGSISFAKGCYVGQEVISRTKYQGVVRKKLFKLVGDTPIKGLKYGNEISLADNSADATAKKIGHFCSSYKNLAICLMNEEKFLGLAVKKVIINNITLNIESPPWRK